MKLPTKYKKGVNKIAKDTYNSSDFKSFKTYKEFVDIMAEVVYESKSKNQHTN